ncbi:sulfatase-like hydrolase/transferase [Dyadobacter sandarakinus]|uniref:Sulfatase-like hydrolase/transferase n=1 Tax=Dyadobacter sandarakinus TaxID=2747268 RepID=A0ABX7I4Q4_9BACT|nr:sulfatase-like hydrolase/transferase [Dyadobacter sandarakinus]QRR00760.1 sulfatase-like hydrolase/transferase [Dyadobacter sandarakinus]
MKIFTKRILIGLTILQAACYGFTASEISVTSEKQHAAKPNILFIFADDLRADALGYAGNTIIQTPNIDQLAASGTHFKNCYVMGGHHGAICAPSRAMLMSGKSLFHVYDKLDGVHTMPQHFAENGYETFGTGKWHNGAETFEASFQKGKTIMLGGMSDHFKVPVCDLDANRKLGKPVVKGFSTDIFTESALSYLDEYAKGSRKNPFFCYVAYTAPHDPRSPREDYIGKYPEKDIPLPGNYKPVHPFDFGDAQVRDENLAPWPRTPEIIKATLSDYYGLISHLDARIGDLIQSLKEKGLYENTIIVFAADNGLAVGSHGLLGKQSLYEHSMKVPLILTGPGIPKNSATDALVYLFDIFPTLTTVACLPEPERIDGKNLSDVISGKSAQVRESSFTAYRHLVRAVRDQEWKLIRYPNRDYTQLFNLKKDPLELENLAGKPAYRKQEERLKKRLIRWQQQTGDTVAYTAKTILPMQYKPEQFERTMDQQQPVYTQKKYWDKR